MTSQDEPITGARSLRLAVAVIAGAVIGTACGRGGDDAAATATPVAAATPAVTMVDIKGFMFQPTPLRIAVGTTAQWTNQDEILHTVTSGMRTYDEQHLQKDIIPGPPGFDFPLDGKGRTATFTFSQAGSFSYLCSRHPGMDAQIVVG